jgi:FAD/FMN-containing dehydrogenase
MAPSLEDNQYRLKTFLEDHPDIKYIPPTAPDFSSLSALYIQSSPTTPLAVVRPQTADHVASLVSFCTAHAIQFTVRTGGKNLFRLSSAQDALMIDMRDMNYVQIDAAKSSATVGGGVLQDKLAAELAKEGLVTPSGAFGFVGFVGWSTYGGYGPLASHYGLGLDNILGAKVVNAKGEVVVADKELLKCIRGAGGAFGVIIELTVKVYPLHRVSWLELVAVWLNVDS